MNVQGRFSNIFSVTLSSLLELPVLLFDHAGARAQ